MCKHVVVLLFKIVKTILNTSFFIAKRIAFNSISSFSTFIIRLSIVATALSVAIMILTVCFVNGFQESISNKIYNFWGHIRVQHYENSKAIVEEELPIQKNDTVIKILQQQPNLQMVSSFATKNAVISFNKEIEGVLLKGIEKHTSPLPIEQFIVKGRNINLTADTNYVKEILIPLPVATSLNIQLNDVLIAYFISNNNTTNTYRKLKVVGIYKTGIEEFDKLFAIVDIRLIQLLNNWQPNEIGGYEVYFKSSKEIEKNNLQLLDKLPSIWMSRTINDIYPNIFEWLQIQNVNRNVVFVIMGLIALINLITCLLILVLNRTKTIGVLKALGASNALVQKIFLYYAFLIALIGVGVGLLVGVGFCFLQQETHFITLNESAYYIAYAPVSIYFKDIALICTTAIIVCFLTLYLPTFIVKKVQPVKAIQFS
jgi:lipoprotein-releasing system permease protein